MDTWMYSEHLPELTNCPSQPDHRKCERFMVLSSYITSSPSQSNFSFCRLQLLHIRYEYETRGVNILRQIMVTFLTYISNACHSLSGVAERLQHTVRVP